ncbi:hypothetical protein AKO1_010440 [Acrasis kona]|uniref:Gustatory receptor n=1 Tax=Acrasis kona TaxID=1008807 RepID=A0AAW2ZLE4_9EUKA
MSIFDAENDDGFLAATNIVSFSIVLVSLPSTIIVLVLCIRRYRQERKKHSKEHLTIRQLMKYLISFCTLMLLISDLMFESLYIPSQITQYIHHKNHNSTVLTGLAVTTELTEGLLTISGAWSLFMILAVLITLQHYDNLTAYKSRLRYLKIIVLCLVLLPTTMITIVCCILGVRFIVNGDDRENFIYGVTVDIFHSIIFVGLILFIIIIRIVIAIKFKTNPHRFRIHSLEMFEKYKARVTFAKIARYSYPYFISTALVVFARTWWNIDLIIRLVRNNYVYKDLDEDPDLVEKILYSIAIIVLPLRCLINSFVFLFVDKSFRNALREYWNKSQDDANLMLKIVDAEDAKINKMDVDNFLDDVEGGVIFPVDTTNDVKTPIISASPHKFMYIDYNMKS